MIDGGVIAPQPRRLSGGHEFVWLRDEIDRRRGIETERGQLLRDVQERNAERALQAEPIAQQEQGAALEP